MFTNTVYSKHLSSLIRNQWHDKSVSWNVTILLDGFVTVKFGECMVRHDVILYCEKSLLQKVFEEV